MFANEKYVCCHVNRADICHCRDNNTINMIQTKANTKTIPYLVKNAIIKTIDNCSCLDITAKMFFHIIN